MSDNALEKQNGCRFPRQPPYKEHTADFSLHCRNNTIKQAPSSFGREQA